MNLTWNKCQGDIWCSLNTVDLTQSHFNNMDGVYVIWHGGDNPATVRVGQGNIRDRLTAHRNDPEVQQYEQLRLSVTWAEVDDQYQDGVEAYLADALNPLVGERFPNVNRIRVNLPWD